MFKVDHKTETLANALIARANSEILIMDVAERKAHENGTTYEHEFTKLESKRNSIVENLIDNMPKYI